MDALEHKAYLLAKTEAEKLNLKIVSVEWVKEYGNNILRIIATSSSGLNIEEAEKLNNLISDALDVEDFISEEYMLEVSSPGLERVLEGNEDITNSIGEFVHIEFFDKFFISKKQTTLSMEGVLKGYLNNVMTIEYNNKGQIKIFNIEIEKIKLIRLAIKF